MADSRIVTVRDVTLVDAMSEDEYHPRVTDERGVHVLVFQVQDHHRLRKYWSTFRRIRSRRYTWVAHSAVQYF